MHASTDQLERWDVPGTSTPETEAMDLAAELEAARSLPPQQKAAVMKGLAQKLKASGQATEVLDGVVDTAKKIVDLGLLH